MNCELVYFLFLIVVTMVWVFVSYYLMSEYLPIQDEFCEVISLFGAFIIFIVGIHPQTAQWYIFC